MKRAAIFLGESPNAIAWIGVGMVIVGGLVAATSATKEQEAIGVQTAL